MPDAGRQAPRYDWSLLASPLSPLADGGGSLYSSSRRYHNDCGA